MKIWKQIVILWSALGVLGMMIWWLYLWYIIALVWLIPLYVLVQFVAIETQYIQNYIKWVLVVLCVLTSAFAFSVSATWLVASIVLYIWIWRVYVLTQEELLNRVHVSVYRLFTHAKSSAWLLVVFLFVSMFGLFPRVSTTCQKLAVTVPHESWYTLTLWDLVQWTRTYDWSQATIKDANPLNIDFDWSIVVISWSIASWNTWMIVWTTTWAILSWVNLTWILASWLLIWESSWLYDINTGLQPPKTSWIWRWSWILTHDAAPDTSILGALSTLSSQINTATLQYADTPVCDYLLTNFASRYDSSEFRIWMIILWVLIFSPLMSILLWVVWLCTVIIFSVLRAVGLYRSIKSWSEVEEII